MRISLIVAMDKNNLIGSSNQIAWHIPGELKRFRNITMGKPIVMGRKTHESIGKPLDGRVNIVLTKRAEHLRHHKGQISLPGGKLELQDNGDYKECAFREANEEIGFKKNNVIYLGKLNKYITGSGFLIQPIVVLVEESQNFIVNRQEVTSILHFPINYLLSNNVIRKVFVDEGRKKFS